MKKLKTLQEFLNEEYDEEEEDWENLSDDEEYEEDVDKEELPVLTKEMITTEFLDKYMDSSYTLQYASQGDSFDESLDDIMKIFDDKGYQEALDKMYDIVNDGYEGEHYYENEALEEITGKIEEDYNIEEVEDYLDDSIRELITERDDSDVFSEIAKQTKDVKVFYHKLKDLVLHQNEELKDILKSNKLILKRLGVSTTTENREAVDKMLSDEYTDVESIDTVGIILEMGIWDFLTSFEKYKKITTTDLYLAYSDGNYNGDSIKLEGTLSLDWEENYVCRCEDALEDATTCNFIFKEEDPTD